MVATPGDPRNGIPIDELREEVRIDAGVWWLMHRRQDGRHGHVCRGARKRSSAGKRVARGVRLYIQFGSQKIKQYARHKGYIEIFERAGAELIDPSCGACINAGPGASPSAETVTVSAQNRNFPGRSGPESSTSPHPMLLQPRQLRARSSNPPSSLNRAPRKIPLNPTS